MKRRISRALPLGIGALFLLSLLLGTSCGSEATENSTVITPIERIQGLELSLLALQTDINEGVQDYDIIQDRVDQIRDDLDALASQINNYTCPITQEMYDEITANVTILQRTSFTLHQRIDILEGTCNAS